MSNGPWPSRRRTSYEVFKGEVPLWAKTHPLSPIFPLFLRLFRILLISGPSWILRAIRLILFVICLAPAWYFGLEYYLGSTEVIRNLRYGKQPRNFLDIYLPQSDFREQRPVLIFITGGIWLIGYKAWGMFVGRVLSSFGIVVVLPDYRNFPQGSMPDMLEDVDRSIGWVRRNIEQFGGDRNSIFLMGQSAGAHLGLLTVLRKAKQEFEQSKDVQNSLLDKQQTGWSTSDIVSFIGIAGPYNVFDLQGAFVARGLSLKLLHSIFGGEENLKTYSADYYATAQPAFRDPEVLSQIPPIVLLQGTADLCVPYITSKWTAKTLTRVGMKTYLRMYTGKSHTDSIIEDLVYAEDPCKEDMMTDIASIVLAGQQASKVIPTVAHLVKVEPQSHLRQHHPQNLHGLHHEKVFSRAESDSYQQYIGSTGITLDDVINVQPREEESASSIWKGNDDDSIKEFEFLDGKKTPILRPSFWAPYIEKPADFDLKTIRRSVVPYLMWKGARFFNPF